MFLLRRFCYLWIMNFFFTFKTLEYNFFKTILEKFENKNMKCTNFVKTVTKLIENVRV